MPNAEQRDIAEALFEPKQSREEIKNAIKLEEARGYGQKPIPSEELAPVAQPSQHAVRKIAPFEQETLAASQCWPQSVAPPLLYVLGGFVVALGCDFALPPFPKFGFRCLHAATTDGSICGKALVACIRCGVSVIIGRMQSNMMPRPLLAPLRTKPAWLHTALMRAQGFQLTGLVAAA